MTVQCSVALPDVLIFTPSSRVFLRDEHTVQFGLDAARAGLVQARTIRQLADALACFYQPTHSHDAIARLTRIGYSEAVARAMLEELLAFGIVRSATAGAVLLLGASPLARHMRSLLLGAGVAVRCSLGDDVDSLRFLGPRMPVIIVDDLRLPWGRSHNMAELCPTLTFIGVIDGRGVIGPARIHGEGPCPTCVRLHLVERDAAILQLVRQLPRDCAAFRQDPLVVSATAAAATAHVLQILGIAPAPGVPTRRPVPGEATILNPYEPHAAERRLIEAHPRCPDCFDAAG